MSTVLMIVLFHCVFNQPFVQGLIIDAVRIGLSNFIVIFSYVLLVDLYHCAGPRVLSPLTIFLRHSNVTKVLHFPYLSTCVSSSPKKYDLLGNSQQGQPVLDVRIGRHLQTFMIRS